MEYTPEDIVMVQKIFATFHNHLSLRCENPTQINLNDHADEITWDSNTDIVHVVKRWRGGTSTGDNALIPHEWID
ncbi:DUF3732 domain-containing protein [Gorillibacterium timonense]|uniref:DUF3732 domain-containing protein n=1 Tax=Gorillibacterium timonense TaxID=1689269 RepID=UPI001F2C0FB2|nr:DUF3732 domain-containing protein [Gorillibacterium timonense]